MDNMDFFALFSSLGVGGVVSYLIMTWKREDDKNHKSEMMELKEQHRQEIIALTTKQELLQEKTLEALIANTQALGAINKTVSDLASLENIRLRLENMEKAMLK